jgi:hypothetical protein
MRTRRRRSINTDDLPLRLEIATEPNGRFYYVIVRRDGTVDRRSRARFATEAQAQAAGSPVLRRRSFAARLNTPDEQSAWRRIGSHPRFLTPTKP